MKRVLLFAIAGFTAVILAVGAASADGPRPTAESTRAETSGTGHRGVPQQVSGYCTDGSNYSKPGGDYVTYDSYTICSVPTWLYVRSALWWYSPFGWVEVAYDTNVCPASPYCAAGATVGVNPGEYYVYGEHYCPDCIPQWAYTETRPFTVP